MKLEDAILKSIKQYYSGIEPTELYSKMQEKPVYTKDYFDSFEKNMFPDKESKSEDKGGVDEQTE